MPATAHRGITAGLEAERQLEHLTGPDALAYVLAAGIWTQADLARASGLNPATLGAFKKGKRPTAAQRAALAWAIAKRTG